MKWTIKLAILAAAFLLFMGGWYSSLRIDEIDQHNSRKLALFREQMRALEENSTEYDSRALTDALAGSRTPHGLVAEVPFTETEAEDTIATARWLAECVSIAENDTLTRMLRAVAADLRELEQNGWYRNPSQRVLSVETTADAMEVLLFAGYSQSPDLPLLVEQIRSRTLAEGAVGAPDASGSATVPSLPETAAAERVYLLALMEELIDVDEWLALTAIHIPYLNSELERAMEEMDLLRALTALEGIVAGSGRVPSLGNVTGYRWNGGQEGLQVLRSNLGNVTPELLAEWLLEQMKDGRYGAGFGAPDLVTSARVLRALALLDWTVQAPEGHELAVFAAHSYNSMGYFGSSTAETAAAGLILMGTAELEDAVPERSRPPVPEKAPLPRFVPTLLFGLALLLGVFSVASMVDPANAHWHLLLVLFVIVVLVPVFWVIGTALLPTDALDPQHIFPQSPTLKNFSYILFEKDSDGSWPPDFWVWLYNSLIAAVGTTLLGLFLATTAAYAFSRYEFVGKKLSMLSFLVVQMFPGILILVPYYMVMSALGLLDNLLGLVLAYSVTALPLCVWMIKGFFDTIPRELEEAAAIDGASQLKTFYRIILPLAKPALAVTALFSFMAAWNEFLLAYTFMQSDDHYTLAVGINSFLAGKHAEWGHFAAMSILVALPVVVIFMVFQRYLISGMTSGSVKG